MASEGYSGVKHTGRACPPRQAQLCGGQRCDERAYGKAESARTHAEVVRPGLKQLEVDGVGTVAQVAHLHAHVRKLATKLRRLQP